MAEFTHFVGIDWSGAKGKTHKGLAIALCAADEEAPHVINPPSGKMYWGRRECSDWIANGMGLPDHAHALVGLDAAFGYPFDKQNGYLRGDLTINDATELWAEVANECDAEDFFGGQFIDRFSKHYRHQRYNRERRAFDTIVDKAFFKPELRITEKICISDNYGPCQSVFNLIGASQVGKSALSTMIMLNYLREKSDISVWPFDEIEEQSVVLVEIYAAVFSKLGGGRGKVRNLQQLNYTLAGLGSAQYQADLPEDNKVDDVTDALITAAGLRMISSERKYWHPPALSTMVRRTEGWIFGVV